MSATPSGTVTFLFTDIEGSTSRWEHHRDAMQAALERHNALLQAAENAHGGLVFKTVGDAYRAAFADPVAAGDAALGIEGRAALQNALPGFAVPAPTSLFA